MKSVKKKLISIAFIIFAINCYAQTDTVVQEGISLDKRIERFESIINKLDNLSIGGFFQMQYIYAQPNAVLRIGAPNENPGKNFSRIGVRRSRLRFSFDKELVVIVFQLDLSDRGIVIRDAYLKFKDPWLKISEFQTGIFFRPFGYEVRLSSQRREAPERSRIFPIIFPGERDLGASLKLQTEPTSPLKFLTLETALVAGNGVMPETDSRLDFIGNLKGIRNFGYIVFSAGVSYYNGSVFQGTENVYTMQNNGFVLNSSPTNKGGYAKREYFGFDTEITFKNLTIGNTDFVFEYVYGQQPASLTSSTSPNSPRTPTVDTYIRPFNGGHLTIRQDIGKLPFSVFGRYDWYDPNIKVSGNDIGLNGTSATDIAYHTLGAGLIWKIVKNVELQGYYEMPRNETTLNLPEFKYDRKDNMFTVSLLVRY